MIVRGSLVVVGLAALAAALPLTAQEAPEGAVREATAAQAQDPDLLEAQARQLAAELRCPVCQGLSILDSPVELAGEMKQVIRDQLAEGRSPEEVREYFVSKYGEWVLLQPEPRGFNLMVYILPWTGLAAGMGVIVFAVRRWTRRQDEGPDAAFDDEELDDEY